MGNRHCGCCCQWQYIQTYIQNYINNIISTLNIDAKLLGTQAESKNNPQILLNAGDLIPFDTVLTNQNPNVTLDAATGIFTVTKAGDYAVYWFANINGTGGDTTVKLSCNGIGVTAENSVQAQISGFATLSLNAGDTISLMNASGFEVRLDGGNVQAGIQILSV